MPANTPDAIRQFAAKHNSHADCAPDLRILVALSTPWQELSAPRIERRDDDCTITWEPDGPTGRYLTISSNRNGHLSCHAYSGTGAVTSYRTVAQGDHWQPPVHAIIAGAVKDGIIAKLPDRETAPLSLMPSLVQFGRAITAVADLCDQFDTPPQYQWNAIRSLLENLWPDWDCSWLPDDRAASLDSQLVINVVDSPEQRGRIHKWIPRTLLQACALAGVRAGEAEAELDEFVRATQEWLDSGQPLRPRDLGYALHTAAAMLNRLNDLPADQLAELMPGRQPPVTLETFRQDLTLAVLRAHQAGIPALAPPGCTPETAPPDQDHS